jgi:ubiquinol-cytochrome c reductase cytochrome b subunit
MVLGLTGYLLPWDLDAYAASQVAINLTLQMPVIGQYIQYFAQDGTTLGTLTINRFFGLHVWLMPAALVALVAAHLAIFRWNGPAGPPVADPRPLKSGRFWPDQMFMDTAVSFGVFLVIIFLSFVFPPFLDMKADPSNATFIPYPAWYFLDLFGLLNIVPGNLEIIGAIVIPGIATMILFLLPWIDRSTTRTTGSRKFILWLTAVSLVVILALTFWSQAGIVAKQAAAPPPPPAALTGSNAAMPAAAMSTTADAAPALSPTASAKAGAMVFSQNCSSCHGADGKGTPGAFPPLANNPLVVGDASKVIGIVNKGLSGTITVAGATYNGQMPPWKGTLSNNDIANVITYIRTSLGTNTASAVTPAQVAASK